MKLKFILKFEINFDWITCEPPHNFIPLVIYLLSLIYFINSLIKLHFRSIHLLNVIVFNYSKFRYIDDWNSHIPSLHSAFIDFILLSFHSINSFPFRFGINYILLIIITVNLRSIIYKDLPIAECRGYTKE